MFYLFNEAHCHWCGKGCRTAIVPEITITKLNTVYELTNGKETIEAEVHNGKLTLSNHKGSEDFVFVGSDPARIRRMCELFIRACELVEETK